jgi:hypothetical protein
MTQQEKLREEAAICRKSAEHVQDLDSRRALLELAEWWTMQADRARAWEPDGTPTSRGNGRT